MRNNIRLGWNNNKSTDQNLWQGKCCMEAHMPNNITKHMSLTLRKKKTVGCKVLRVHMTSILKRMSDQIPLPFDIYFQVLTHTHIHTHTHTSIYQLWMPFISMSYIY